MMNLDRIKRVHFRIDEDLHRQLKSYVASKGFSLQDYITSMIIDELKKNKCKKD